MRRLNILTRHAHGSDPHCLSPARARVCIDRSIDRSSADHAAAPRAVTR